MARLIKPLRPKFWLVKVLLGAGLLAVFAYSVQQYMAFEAVAVHVPGTVLRVAHESHATGRRGGRVSVDRPVVRYTVPGEAAPREGTAKVMSRKSFDEGSTLDLELDPARPGETLRVAGGWSVLDMAFGVVGLVCLVFGVAEQVSWKRRSKAFAAAQPPRAPLENAT